MKFATVEIVIAERIKIYNMPPKKKDPPFTWDEKMVLYAVHKGQGGEDDKPAEEGGYLDLTKKPAIQHAMEHRTCPLLNQLMDGKVSRHKRTDHRKIWKVWYDHKKVIIMFYSFLMQVLFFPNACSILS